MYELKKWKGIFTSKSVGTGPSSYEKKNLPGRGLTKVEKHCCTVSPAAHLQPHMFLLQEGSPLLWGLSVRAYLDEKITGRWIGREGPVPWPRRSPDITHMDFFRGVMSRVLIASHQSPYAILTVYAVKLPRAWQRACISTGPRP